MNEPEAQDDVVMSALCAARFAPEALMDLGAAHYDQREPLAPGRVLIRRTTWMTRSS